MYKKLVVFQQAVICGCEAQMCHQTKTRVDIHHSTHAGTETSGRKEMQEFVFLAFFSVVASSSNLSTWFESAAKVIRIKEKQC
ncbi:MAG: hypothetical protein WCR50_03700 [Proteiniphilum sp.]|nr:hypothetical protein [Proteiniphilum sp.]NCB25149.1 hypothetical protein [Bacteroidia bacterium]MDD2936845.1 hypothetical protein [Proteiniphilum sp.]MDD3076518.1 hypothetical protein [Proteiniphilum sp.]MDD3779433.1 hypothetical protein [Proteiniphilum sp.]